MQDENRVREMSEEEAEDYQGTTIDSQTGEEEPSRSGRYESWNPFQDVRREQEQWRKVSDLDRIDTMSGLWHFFLHRTSWKTKGIVVLALVACVALFTFALPFLLTIVGSLLIIWLVYSLFMH